MLHIYVNGEPMEIEAGATVSSLLDRLAVKDARVAVEVNLDVVRRDSRSLRSLIEGDRVEIVSFVGGGV